MPGIFGFISAGNQGTRHRLVDQMLPATSREPMFTSGSLVEETFGLEVGWVCHRGSYSDCLPVWNSDNSVGLVFVGEHFGDQKETSRLKNNRSCASSGHDASLLLDIYQDSPSKFFEKLNGVFCGVLIDRQSREVVLFNDRYGLGRVYYHENSDGLYFASEAKSLLNVVPDLRSFDPKGLGEYLTCGCVLQNRSLYSGVALLPGASKWTMRHGHPLTKDNYFDTKEWQEQPKLSASEYYAKLHETFLRTLPRYFQGPQKAALSLTGGLDSRMIIAGVSPAEDTLPCYTFGGTYRDCIDLTLARSIARATKQSHQTIIIGDDFISNFAGLAEQSIDASDGAMDVTGSVELYANSIAREIAPVRLTGNYGSEILRGNVAFKVDPLSPSIFQADFVPHLECAAQNFADESDVNGTEFIVSKQMPWHHHARLAIEQSQLTVRSPFIDNETVAVAYQAPVGDSVNKDIAHRFIADCHPTLNQIPTDRGVAGRPGETDSRFKVFRQEFVPRLEYVYDYGMPQWLAKIDRIMRPLHMERLFLGRQKFYHFRIWYRDQLASFVKDILLDPQTLSRPYLSRKGVEKIVTEHTSGRGNFTREIHKLLSIELIERRLIGRS